MKKMIFNLAFGLLITPAVFGLDSASLSRQSVRLENASSRNELFINFNKDIVLTRVGNSDFALKQLEQPLEFKNADGGIQRQIVIKCDLTQETKNKKVTLASTAKEGHWSVTKIEKIGSSVQRWTLSRKRQSLKMTCVSLEKFENKLEVTTMSSYLIDRVLAENQSPVSEKIQVAGDALSE